MRSTRPGNRLIRAYYLRRLARIATIPAVLALGFLAFEAPAMPPVPTHATPQQIYGFEGDDSLIDDRRKAEADALIASGNYDDETIRPD